MEINDKVFDKMLEELKKIESQLIEINNITGTTQRVNQMKKEISENGWNAICNKYHPDINYKDSACNELFAMYKYVYEDMKNKGEI